MQVAVTSNDSGKVYTLSNEDGAQLTCSCPDFQYRHKDNGGSCKHLVEFQNNFGFAYRPQYQQVEPTYAQKLAEIITFLNDDCRFGTPRQVSNAANVIIQYVAVDLAELVLKP